KVQIVAGEVEKRDGNVLSRGVLKLDDEKFLLKDVSLDRNSFSASVISTDGNVVETVGTISLTRVEKPGKDIWKGTLSIGSDSFKVYIIGHARKFKAPEFPKSVKEYCTGTPEEPECRKISDIPCAQDANSCRDRIATWCESNPEAPQCKFLVHRWCIINHVQDKDVRCRQLGLGVPQAVRERILERDQNKWQDKNWSESEDENESEDSNGNGNNDSNGNDNGNNGNSNNGNEESNDSNGS
ncbi:MAG: hypothetical protein V1847_00810, partial [Candidatus Diapherotrites archaeon]